MHRLFHHILQIMQNISHQTLRNLSKVQLSSHRAQHMH